VGDEPEWNKTGEPQGERHQRGGVKNKRVEDEPEWNKIGDPAKRGNATRGGGVRTGVI
jgi:hypothetical protein